MLPGGIMTVKQETKVSWVNFFLSWILVNAIGISIFSALLTATGPMAWLTVFGGGIIIGAIQWFALRSVIPDIDFSWATFTQFGVFLAILPSFLIVQLVYFLLNAFLLQEVVQELFEGVLGHAIPVVLSILFLSIFQRYQLRKYVSRSGWWVFANVVGIILGLSTVGLMDGLIGSQLMVFLVLGLPFWVLTGAALVYLIYFSPLKDNESVKDMETVIATPT